MSNTDGFPSEDFADEDLNLDALTKLLEANHENILESVDSMESAVESNSSVEVMENKSLEVSHKNSSPKRNGIDAASLGLTLSDEESDDNNTSVTRRNYKKDLLVETVPKLNKNNGNAVETESSFTAGGSCIFSSREETVVDPLEQELRRMEERMKKIKAELIKKKKLDGKNSDVEARRFTKLTDHCSIVKEQTKVLSQEEKQQLLHRLENNKNSVMHSGDTDSEDDEDQRNPFETLFDSYGRTIKKQLGAERHHYSNSSGISSITDSNLPKASYLASSSGSAVSSCLATNNNSKSSKSKEMLSIKRQKVLSKLQSSANSQFVSGSLQPLGNQHLQQSKKVDEALKCPYSGIYIMNPVVSQSIISERMDGRRYLSLPTVPLHVRGGEVEGDWVTIAVLVAKGQPRTSQKRNRESVENRESAGTESRREPRVGGNRESAGTESRREPRVCGTECWREPRVGRKRELTGNYSQQKMRLVKRATV